MSQETPIALASRFESQARRNFEERVAECRRRTLELLTRGTPHNPEFDAREATRMLMAITGQERWTLLHRVMANTDGPETLEGMEDLRSFIANYLLDDSECMVVPEPFDPENPGYTTLLSLREGDDDCAGLTGDELAAKVRAEWQERDRPLVVVPHVEGVGRVARAAEIVHAIRFNRDMENRRTQMYRDTYGVEDGDGEVDADLQLLPSL